VAGLGQGVTTAGNFGPKAEQEKSLPLLVVALAFIDRGPTINPSVNGEPVSEC
jgi:hypothetical protein